MTNYNTTISVDLPADGTPVKRNMVFSYLMVRAASFDFEMSFDGENFFPMAQGEALGPLAEDSHAIYLRAINGNAQTVQVRCSNVANANNRLNIIHDANQVLSVGAKVPATYLVCTNQNIAAGATLAVPGVNMGNLRKDIIISNLDAANVLVIQNAANINGGIVYPQDNLPLETSDTVKINNPNGAAVAVLVMEIYYAA